MARKRVWIVNQGGFAGLSAEKGDYDSHIQVIRNALNNPVIRRELSLVEVVMDIGESLPHILSMENESVLVFMTKGMLDRATRIKEEHPNLRVMVLSAAPDQTGLFEGVHVLDKDVLRDYKGIPRIILGEEPTDWTVTEGGNVSPEFLRLVEVVGGLIRQNGNRLITGDTNGVARLIMTNLAREQGLQPKSVQ